MTKAELYGYEEGQDEWRKLKAINAGGATDTKGSLGVIGHYPPGCTQVYESGNAENAWVDIYTIPSGKTLYLCSGALSIYNLNANVGHGFLSVRTSGSVLVDHLLEMAAATEDGNGNSNQYFPALQLPATYKISIFSNQATLYAYGIIHGFVM